MSGDELAREVNEVLRTALVWRKSTHHWTGQEAADLATAVDKLEESTFRVREYARCYDVLDDGSDSTLFMLIHQLKEQAESTAARLAEAQSKTKIADAAIEYVDKRQAKVEASASYGMLCFEIGLFRRARASRAGTGETR